MNDKDDLKKFIKNLKVSFCISFEQKIQNTNNIGQSQRTLILFFSQALNESTLRSVHYRENHFDKTLYKSIFFLYYLKWLIICLILNANEYEVLSFLKKFYFHTVFCTNVDNEPLLFKIKQFAVMIF